MGGYATEIRVVSESCNSSVHRASITPEDDYHTSNSNVINLLCVCGGKGGVSLQLTVSVFRQAVGR